MTRRLVGILMVMFVATLTLAKVRIDFDERVDFSRYETFAWKKTPTTSLDEDYPSIHLMIVRGMEYYLLEGDLLEVDEDPDLWVTYHARTRSELRVDTNQLGYSYGVGWAWDPYWGGPGAIPMTGHLRTYSSGTLVIDLIDARRDELIWRGTAEGKLPYDRDKLKRKIDTTLRKMVNKWRRTYRGE